MPDIGLLQGPPRKPHLKVVQDAPAPREARAYVTPMLIPMVAESDAIKVAAHAAVVSEAPLAVLVAADEPGPLIHAAANEPGHVAAPVHTPPRDPSPVFALPPIRISDLLWLLLGLVVIVGTGLGVRDPWPADEPRFASLARDMVQSGEWLFPRVGGDLYQDKPPLFFWLLALCYSLFGSVKASFLIPAFLAAGGVLFLIYDFGRRTVSREAGLGAALTVLCTLQFVLAFRGAQIDPVLCLLTTFSLYALLRHLMLGDGWRWYFFSGFAAGLGVFTKGVGFLPMLALIPFFTLRGLEWKGLATLDAGRAGWRWWLAPLAMLLAVSLWFVPMLLAVASSGSPEYAAYRDEILLKQTVGRYAAAWHHVKGWYYFIAEVIPPLWLPWSLLLFWLVPRFKAAYHDRDARVWLPLFWLALVVLFFSMSPGKRGIYIMPALPALAFASLPVLPGVLARRGVRVAGFVLAVAFFAAGLAMAVGYGIGAGFAVDALTDANLANATALYVYLALCGVGLLVAWRRAPLIAWPVALGSLTIVFSYFIAPAMNGERSGSDFMRSTLSHVKPDEELGLVAYKEQFLLYLDRPTVNFGHRRWQEGPQEYFDAAAWLNAAPHRVLLVPKEALAPEDRFDLTQPAVPCFTVNATKAGASSGDDWFLVRAPAESACAALGDARRAIRYH
ncbi:MAG TPA: glycosyltransferase family 39 protein [Steroidobacteraceae bacterium]|nr:glycosyltransferase family 39 protein [Steroidobacteraceae bacterium]